MAQPGPLKNQIVWVRLSDNVPAFSRDGFYDPSPGPNSPHIEIYSSQISTDVPATDGQVPLPTDGPSLL